MSEGMLLVVWVVKMLILTLCGALYRIGGWINKAIRRYLMPVIFMGACVGIVFWKGMVFNAWMLLSLPLLIGSLVMGYSNNQGTGWIKRLKIAGLLSLSFIPFALVFNRWELYVAHVVLCFLGMGYFGITNPFKEAVAEEATIGTLALMMPIMMI